MFPLSNEKPQRLAERRIGCNRGSGRIMPVSVLKSTQWGRESD